MQFIMHDFCVSHPSLSLFSVRVEYALRRESGLKPRLTSSCSEVKMLPFNSFASQSSTSNGALITNKGPAISFLQRKSPYANRTLDADGDG